MFDKKYAQKNKVIDLSLFPLKIWKSAVNPIVSAPEIYENGWTVTGDIEWVEQIFRDVIEDILMDDKCKET